MRKEKCNQFLFVLNSLRSRIWSHSAVDVMYIFSERFLTKVSCVVRDREKRHL